jgi:hypothetical protein
MFKQPDVEPIKYKNIADKYFQLEEDYTVRVHINGVLQSITVPKGYITDLASIPRFVWTLTGLTPDGLYRGAAVVHDYIYGMKNGMGYSAVVSSDKTQVFRLSRQECDKIFRELMEDAGESDWKVKTFFWAVETFGWMYY